MHMAFSDFSPREPTIRYSSAAEDAAYLQDYASHFHLHEHIRLNTLVQRAALVQDRWVLTVASPDGSETQLLADVLVVAAGAHQIPQKAHLEGFTGETLHSRQYRSANDYSGNRVLIVGTGESASDVAADVAETALQTTVWGRSPLLEAPRLPFQMVLDPHYDEMCRMADPKEPRGTRVADFLEMATTSRMANAVPLWFYAFLRHLLAFFGRFAPAPARRHHT